MSDFNNLESIVPDRSKPQPKPPKKPKKEQEEPMKPVKQPEDLQAEKSIEFIFDKTRDVGLAQPYHLDGDPQMYTPENLSKRSSLYDDPDIQKELENVCSIPKAVCKFIPFFSQRHSVVLGVQESPRSTSGYVETRNEPIRA